MIRPIASFSLIIFFASAALAAPNAARIYADKCAQCHGADRLGGTGPALIPETLSNTVLGSSRPGALLHLETDVLAKYVQRMGAGSEPTALDGLFGNGRLDAAR